MKKVFSSYSFLAIPILLLSLTILNCNKKEKDPKILEMEEKIQKISTEFKLSISSLEKIGIDLDELQRNCSLKFSESSEKKEIRDKKIIDCRVKEREELFKKNNLSVKYLDDIIQAHIFLQWEWKYFQKNQNSNLSEVKKIYSEGMSEMFQCMKLLQSGKESKDAYDRRVEKCSEEKFYSICKKNKFDEYNCGKIISMGTDYGWEIESEKKTQMLNPVAPENKN
ncbi:MAG: hypothetical protein L6Q54_08540 [Leptospiraceae bacterium]|nr:hypothetical protein [Leptospiraceae bacterium]MCK6381281.1 hypothetical protein [Leptospiraceae bacterium]NUM40406.1 hypothetical protein [Leptospiraceae bacterium]